MNHIRLNQLLKSAADPAFRDAMEQLGARVKEAGLIGYEISAGERGQWSHYYYCPLDGTKLGFDWSLPDAHKCLACGTVWQGEPYDGAWVTLANAKIGRMMRDVALHSLIHGEDDAFSQVREVLLRYARYYTGYEIHGNIPYNGPGKLFAQTLDEAHWIIDLSYAYAFVHNRLEPEDRESIRERLLRPCVEFLTMYRERQIHNHAILITSAIGIVGFLLGDEVLLNSSLYDPFGLYDQLAYGVLEDGLWYEGNFHYHYYAFDSLLKYAILVEGTQWDLCKHPAMKRLFDFPLGYLLPDGTLPNINDASFDKKLADLAPYYEVAYAWYGSERYAELLRLAYGYETTLGLSFAQTRRDSFEALAFGQSLIRTKGGRDLTQMLVSDRSSAASGLTKLVNRRGWHVLVKHSTFGGEHDHMDRLGLSFGTGRVPMFVDPGTTAYGVPAHYGWFKHTYAHNTVALNGQDQPPADGEWVQYLRESWGSLIESRVSWIGEPVSYRMKDFILLPKEMCTWDAGAYRGTCIRRINILTEETLLDIVKVSVSASRDIDLLYHISGTLEESGAQWRSWPGRLCALSTEWMDDMQHGDRYSEASYRWKVGDGELLQASWCSEVIEPFLARTPDIPMSGSRQTLCQRVQSGGAREVVFVSAFRYHTEDELNLSSENEGLRTMKRLSFEVTDCGAGEFLIRLGTRGKKQVWRLLWSDQAAVVELTN
ncbi:heparinase II/III family protein [Paenibacillus sp. AN1007]|uniref:Heparinase II/III family protein n=1 Tax=Paenibacillus sp. AN1007 TaxID=3151385 RepID=A0AAU8NLU9_9BACL